MGMKVTSAFNNDKAVKVFTHIIAKQLVDEVRQEVEQSHFLSWMIDGSAAAKKRLTNEAELIYIRTSNQLCPTIRLFSFVSMQPYAQVNSENLTHALITELIKLADKEASKDLHPDTPTETLIQRLKTTGIHMKVVAAGT